MLLDIILDYLSNITMTSRTEMQSHHHLLHLQLHTPDLLSPCLACCFAFFGSSVQNWVKIVLFCVLQHFADINEHTRCGIQQVTRSIQLSFPLMQFLQYLFSSSCQRISYKNKEVDTQLTKITGDAK